MKKLLQKIGITKNFFLWEVCLVLLFIAVFMAKMVLFPTITLKGKSRMVVEYEDLYEEKGYHASFLGKDVTKDVKVKGKVNTKKLGEYKITYTYKKGILTKQVVRTVSVKDLTKPVLEMKKEDAYVCPGKQYQVEEVKATDNYDGDLTKKVKNEIKTNKVTYSVADSSGNKTSITKKILYEDKEKPVLTLNGPGVIDLCSNDVYKEPGYTAVDNCDEDLTDKVTIDGGVDTSIIGEYNLTYKVADAAGNEDSKSRQVRVSDKDYAGVVYLTFDDGPQEGTTDVILDILKEEGVEATFFVTNKGPDYLIQREYNEGHTVALHTASHDYAKIYASDDAYFADLQQVHDRVYNLTGYDSHFIRFPGGASNTVSRRYNQGIMSRLTQEVQNRGYKYYDWNISSGDAGGTTNPRVVAWNVTSGLRKDRVNMVLMHDIKTHTRDALRDIIRYCKDNGYQMKKINNCSTMVTQRVNN